MVRKLFSLNILAETAGKIRDVGRKVYRDYRDHSESSSILKFDVSKHEKVDHSNPDEYARNIG
jgi:hypothetical protein